MLKKIVFRFKIDEGSWKVPEILEIMLRSNNTALMAAIPVRSKRLDRIILNIEFLHLFLLVLIDSLMYVFKRICMTEILPVFLCVRFCYYRCRNAAGKLACLRVDSFSELHF
jgi:hypothetical protein